jgi:hypothetical protein
MPPTIGSIKQSNTHTHTYTHTYIHTHTHVTVCVFFCGHDFRIKPDFFTRYKFRRFPEFQVQYRKEMEVMQGCRAAVTPSKRSLEILLGFEFRCETKCTRKRNTRAIERMDVDTV